MTDLSSIQKLSQLSEQYFQAGNFLKSARIQSKCVGYFKKNPDVISDHQKAEFYNQYGLSLKRSGDLVLAEKIYLKANRLTNFQNHCFLNNLAVCYFKIGGYPLAKQYYGKAIDSLRIHGSNQLSMALYQSNLGTLLYHVGDFQNAKGKLINSLETFQRIGSLYDSSNVKYRLGHMVYMMGYFADSIKILHDAYQEKLDIFSSDHPRAAEVQLALAEVYQTRQKLRKAKDMASAALLIFEKELDMNDPHIGRCYLLLAKNQSPRSLIDEKVITYLQKAYAIFRKSYPSQLNPNMANYYALRGELLVHNRKYHRAIHYLNKSLYIRQNLFEAIHPVLAENFNNLGFCYANIGRRSEARKFYIKSLHIFKRVHRKHPWLPSLLRNIAYLYKNTIIEEICLNCEMTILKEAPDLLKEANLAKPTQPEIISNVKQKKINRPEIKIIIIATPDMKGYVKVLSEKIHFMIDYHEDSLLEISQELYIQNDLQISTITFDELVVCDLKTLYHCGFILLVGEKYGTPVAIGQNVLKECPWVTNYRDRSGWEILIRHLIDNNVGGKIYYFAKKPSRIKTQHPYFKIQSFLQEIRKKKDIPEIGFKAIRKKDMSYVGLMMNELNLTVLSAKKQFEKEMSNVGNSMR